MDATNITRLAEHIRKEVESEVNAPLVLYMARGIFLSTPLNHWTQLANSLCKMGGEKKCKITKKWDNDIFF